MLIVHLLTSMVKTTNGFLYEKDKNHGIKCV
jgi:hypothetical protein